MNIEQQIVEFATIETSQDCLSDLIDDHSLNQDLVFNVEQGAIDND